MADQELVKIKDLNWSSFGRKFCARVTWYQPPEKSKSGNEYMKFLLRDESGMIEAVAVGEETVKFYRKKLKLYEVYRFENFTLQPCRTENANVGHKYFIYLNSNTEVTSTNKLPPEKFYSVAWLVEHSKLIKATACVDVCGKVLGEIDENGKCREIQLGDEQSNVWISLKLWNEHAERRYIKGDHLMMRQVLLRCVDGKPTLSTLYRTMIDKHQRKIKAETTTDTDQISERNTVSFEESEVNESFLEPWVEKVYLDAIKSGSEQSNVIRLMLVGHEGVGKTTLVRKLMNQQTEIEPESTDGIEIHKHTCIVEKSGQWCAVQESLEENMLRRIASDQSALSIDSGLGSMDVDQEVLEVVECKAKRENNQYTDICSNKKRQKTRNFDRESATCQPSNPANSHYLGAFQKILKNNEKNDFQYLNIWDFAGQYIFYATHQLFLSPRAIYLLVINLTKTLHCTIHDDEGASLRTVSDFCEFWMHSIYTFAGKEKELSPVILVGTHSDCLDKDPQSACDDLFEKVRCNLDPSISRLFYSEPFSTGLQSQNCFDETESLRKCILEVSKNLSCSKTPTKWIPLENQLLEKAHKENMKFITLQEVERINSSLSYQIPDVEAFLSYHHEIGTFLYFREAGLTDIVVLNPKWIIDAFASIITTTNFFKKKSKSKLNRLWKDTKKNAKIDETQLVEKVWKQEPEFYENREFLLKVMQHLHMIARVHKYGDDESLLPCKEFIIPSFLSSKKSLDSSVLSLIKNRNIQKTHTLGYYFLNSKVSILLYYHVLAVAIGNWEPHKDGKGNLMLSNKMSIFKLDKVHFGIIECDSKSIKLYVVCFKAESDVDPNVSLRFRLCTEEVLNSRFKGCAFEREKSYDVRIKCSSNQNGNVNDFVSFQDLQEQENIICCHDPQHSLNIDEVVTQWFHDEGYEIGYKKYLTDEMKSLPVEEEHINELAKILQEEWKILAGSLLGLDHYKIQLLADGKFKGCSTKLCYFELLNMWKKREGHRANWQCLVTKFDELKVNICGKRFKRMLTKLKHHGEIQVKMKN